MYEKSIDSYASQMYEKTIKLL